ncbi:MAG: hypothetical protein PHP25_04035 [Candidatus Moranbacteria bacterium]|nr:hypothetical protein [Candidatus Moranbacteria bacterium]
MFSHTDILANIENTIRAKIFLFAKAKTTSETINDAPNRKNVIHKSTLGSPKNNMVFILPFSV